MVLERIEEIINNKNKVNFKLYGIAYTIAKNEDNYCIYQTLNKSRQKKYKISNSMLTLWDFYCIVFSIIKKEGGLYVSTITYNIVFNMLSFSFYE